MNPPRTAAVRAEAKLRDRDRADTELGRPAARDLVRYSALPAQREADRVGIEHVQRHRSAERVSELGDRRALRPFDIVLERPETIEKILGPLVERFEHDLATDPMSHDLCL